jgi:magnesium transporter
MHPLPPPKRPTAIASIDALLAHDHLPEAPAPPQGPQAASKSTLPSAMVGTAPAAGEGTRKRRKHRGGKRKKNRRQSFAEASLMQENTILEHPLLEGDKGTVPFYALGAKGNLSEESIDSEALLDHRCGLKIVC